MEREVKVKSLQKAIEILNCFTQKKTWGVTELSEHLSLNKSNVHSILSTFKAMEYLEQDAETGRYQMGMAVYRLSHALRDDLVIVNIALPYMQELADYSGERVYLAIPHKDEAVYLSSTYPQEAVYLMRTIIGETAKMYCTGIGKAMMAYLPAAEQEFCLNQKMEAFTESTITDPEVLRKDLEQIRIRGYAVDNMEHEYGIKCVAVPVINEQGGVEGAISISGPSLRFDEERIEELAEILTEKVKKIQRRL